MSVSSEVKRTLVKSPPELWNELSDAESLARHLGDLEGVRITRAEPERAVQWEADGATGSVRLEPSGFGTKVILSLTRDLAEQDHPSSEQDHPSEQDQPTVPHHAASGAEGQPAATDTQHDSAADSTEPDPVADTPVEAEPIEQTTVELQMAAMEEESPEPAPADAPKRRVGVFTRLFRRRSKERFAPFEPAPEPELLAWAAHEPQQDAAPVPEPEPHPVESQLAEPEPADIAGELATLEGQIAERDSALLTAALDRLGAAHHRPFSRG
jgi:hypothetical protein